MKVEFDCWEMCGEGSAFILEMSCVPRIGESLCVHKSLFPDYYAKAGFAPLDWEHQLSHEVDVVVRDIAHQIDADGTHLVRVDFDYTDESE